MAVKMGNTKTCTVCGLEDVLLSYCQKCRLAYDRKYTEANRDKVRARHKKYQKENKDKIRATKIIYHEKNKESINARCRKYRKENKNQLRDKKKIHTDNRLKTDVQFKLKRTLRVRFSAAIRGEYKSGSAVRDLGCSIDFLKKHLEAQFTEGMTWDNWGSGSGKWGIDHIMPITAFDLTNQQHTLLVCHYGNLQPLWSEDNLYKMAKVPTWENYRTIHECNKIAA